MTRVHNWPEKLDEVLVANRDRTFAYGTFDCALFAADVVKEITGTDYAAELRGYDSQLSAYRIVKQFGSIESMVTKLLGKEPIHPSGAHRGDVVLASLELASGEQGEILGIVAGARCFAPTAKGLRTFPRSAARLAWRIE
jgi:hypothetical protein